MPFTKEDVEASVGSRTEIAVGSWTSKDALLYALSVGAGQDAPFDELEFTTENGPLPQKVLPSVVCVAAPRTGRAGNLSWDMRRLLHGAHGWRGGFGILLDDLVAAFCTLLVMALSRAW